MPPYTHAFSKKRCSIIKARIQNNLFFVFCFLLLFLFSSWTPDNFQSEENQKESAEVLLQDNLVADFITDCSPCDFSKPVQFINLSKGGNSYHWDFSDGCTSTAEYPKHTFNLPGHYDVTLTVEGGDLQQGVYIGSVEILDL